MFNPLTADYWTISNSQKLKIGYLLPPFNFLSLIENGITILSSKDVLLDSKRLNAVAERLGLKKTNLFLIATTPIIRFLIVARETY